MNDYKRIRRDPTYSKLRTIDTFGVHQVSVKWLTESLMKSQSKWIVIECNNAQESGYSGNSPFLLWQRIIEIEKKTHENKYI